MKKVLELIEGALKALVESKATGPRAESMKSHLEACASNAKAELAEAPKGKEAKEGGFARVKVMVLAAVLGLAGLVLLAMASTARADSFNATNVIYSTISLVSFPTNVAGTNGIPQFTGGPISVANQEWAGFYFTGQPIAGSNSTYTVALVRSYSSSQPQVLINTNGTGIYRNDWESRPFAYLSWDNCQSNWPTTTNVFTWGTNLDRFMLGGAQWVGIYSITNNTTNTCVWTNVDMGLSKKIIPLRYP